ncbi:hypothetical protein HHK36_005906 [Tetracentron sinense]|uniref:Uncharacterized protein n=1 Tax=Tetracentron sinense TaxID=13715 RepID=A0A834ZP74_TETSI|nr:hypothetical protein HHK36_005906 [Tetracentron sinense]
MLARHRSPGNGVRSNSMGMGLATARISPEGSLRGHGMHNTEYRNFNRGFGRGPPKPYPVPQLPRRGDTFIEAGRLAAEYLVSQGALPPTVLRGKWQNSSLKNQMGDFLEFRPQDRENLQLPTDGRTSALARLGTVVPDAVPARRRFPDEFNPTGSKNHMRGRRRMGSFRGYGSESGRENGRNDSWSDKASFSPDMEGKDVLVSVDHEERRVGTDIVGGVQKVASSESLKNCNAGDSEPELENCKFIDDTGSKVSSSSTRKDLPLETDGELAKGSNDSRISNAGSGEVKDGESNDETEKHDYAVDCFMQHCAMEGEPVSKSSNDLLRLCSFAKVPTKTRSSLTHKGSKVDPVLTTEEENTCDIGPPQRFKVPMEEDSVEGSSSGTLTNRSQSSRCLEFDVSRATSVQSKEDAKDLSLTSAVEMGRCMRSQSFPERSSFIYEQESSQGPPGFLRCSSVVKGRGEKRVLQHDDAREGTKLPRVWPSSAATQTNQYFHLCNLTEKQSSSHEERPSPDEEVVEAVDQEGMVDVSLLPKGGAEPSIEFREEKQLFPSSFKICDLNLMEASDMTENDNGDQVLDFPSILESRKEDALVDVDLSISNNCNRSYDYDKHSTDAKEVEVVDVADDSVKEDKASDISERKIENIYSGLECFPNQTENTGDLPDIQDGYGLMISELLGNDISNCSSVPADITALHTEMGLHNGELKLGSYKNIREHDFAIKALMLSENSCLAEWVDGKLLKGADYVHNNKFKIDQSHEGS